MPARDAIVSIRRHNVACAVHSGRAAPGYYYRWSFPSPPPRPSSRAQPADLIDADGCPDRPSSFYMPSTIDTTSDHACHCQRCGTCTSRTVPAGWPQACTLHSRPVTSRAGGMRVTALRPLAAHPIQCMRVVCRSSVR